jgi:hypothetical protein
MNTETIKRQVLAELAARELVQAARAGNSARLSVAAANSNKALFQVHAAGCNDIIKNTLRTGQPPFAQVDTLDAAADAIASCYGGYSDNGDAPVDAQHALSWAKVHGCVRAAIKKEA